MSGKTLKQTYKVEWHAWRNMKARCQNKNLPNYHRYGGRGIKVCDEWLGKDGFENFLTSMGLRPSPEYSLDRKNNDKDYTPENCKWSTAKEQSNNQETNIRLTYNGETLTLAQWAEKIGMKYDQIRARYRYGWSAEDILKNPKNAHTKERSNDKNTKLLTYKGKTMNIAQWAKELGCSYEIVRTRVRNGWSVERTLETPVKKSKLYKRGDNA